MATAISALEEDDKSVLILTREESELFLEVAKNNPNIIHDAERLYYDTTTEVMVMIDKEVYNERRNSNN